ncbi:MAG: type II toxin-antitoxin system RelE/ParE family toxin [Eubacteriales bacterium]|nr:type II toxin-antitoxin system RelE/ParE family toxin [Eubacteriales bacterium]
MSAYRITLTNRAKEDIIDIGDYITYTLLEPKTAQNFVKGLRKSIATLNEFPARYPFVDDMILRYQGIRCMPYKNYYIFYEVSEMMQTVNVLRIGYNRRNWKEILK